MPQSHRLLDAHHTKTAVLVIVQIGAANAAKRHPHAQLASAQNLGKIERIGQQMLQSQIQSTMAHQGANASLRRVKRAVGHANGKVRRLGRSGNAIYRLAVTPPSTYRMCPLTKFDASLAKNTAAPARSSTLPQRRLGVRPISQVLNFSSATRAALSSVSK